VNKIKVISTGLLMLALLSLLVIALGPTAQAHPLANTAVAPSLAADATATPDPGMGMMEHPTTTPEAGMMQHDPGMAAQTPGDAMMSTNGTMNNSSLPATGSSDNSDLLLLVAASAVLLLCGVGLRRAIAQRQRK
jgi:LPXTG-motif cell wall-anchored protein